LAETNAYAINDDRVKALAAKAVGDAKTPEEKVRRIVAFVHDFVIPTAMASRPNIGDLLTKKKGDCKSYALLTTTLCRAAGVPSREVAGLLYMGDDAKSFGGHAWNEVVLNGVWVPVDASLNEVEIDAGHIFFGEDNRAAGAMAQTMGKISFKVIESQVTK
jgi:transglutaminase-like putative cysteine protease